MRHILAILLLFLAGCTSAREWNERISTPQERAYALRVIEATRTGDIQFLAANAGPQLRADLTPQLLKTMQEAIPPGKPVLKTVNSNTTSFDLVDTTIKGFNFEMGEGDRWAVFQVLVQTGPKPLRIIGFHIWPAKHSPTGINRFGAVEMGAIHYIWLVAMTLAVVTTLTALFFVFRTRGVRLKWLWAIGCLVSLVMFQLNWTTGAWGVMPLSFLLFGAGAVQADPFSPWVLQFAIPVFAIIFLVRRATGAWTPDPEDEADFFA